MSQPTVACVMLANGRPEMVKRAIASFRAQTYERKELFIWNTGAQEHCEGYDADDITVCHSTDRESIGALRNTANSIGTAMLAPVDVIAHWDSDDWSHPRRIEDQVAALQKSGAEVTGYNDCLFWDSRSGAFSGAWIYSAQHPDYCIGSSLMYWRRTWEQAPFPDRMAGEDTIWLMKRKKHAEPSTGPGRTNPRMVCAIHGGNTTSRIEPGVKEWKRAPHWDAYCGEVMKL